MKKNIIKTVCFVVILAIGTSIINYGLSWKDSLGIRQFYATKNEPIDVMLFGSSHAEYGVNTGYLWDDYGIAAYSMTEGGQNLGTTYYYMVEALKYTKPKVMIVELTFTAPGWELAGLGDGNIYRNSIHMRWSKNYLDNMNYLIDVATNEVGAQEANKLRKNILFKFPVYHTRYKELSLEDFKPINKLRGRYEGSPRVTPQEVPQAIYNTDRAPGGYDDIQRKEYVDAMIDLCAKNDVQLVFWVAPFVVTDEDKMVYNTVGDYCDEKQIPWINFCDAQVQEEIGFDYATDMIENNHVNFDGCRKVTDYFGDYLTKECGVESHTGDPDYATFAGIAKYWDDWEVDLRAEYEKEMAN